MSKPKTPEKRAQMVIDAYDEEYGYIVAAPWLTATIADAIRNAVAAETARCVALVEGYRAQRLSCYDYDDVAVCDELMAAIKGEE